MEKMKKRIKAALCALVLGMMFISGCAGRGIEGTWYLTSEIEPDGTKLDSMRLAEEGISEKYEISGDEVVYTCNISEMDKPIVINFVLEELGNNKYNFNLEGGYTFATVEVKGNTMTYEVGVEEDSSKMIFKRK